MKKRQWFRLGGGGLAALVAAAAVAAGVGTGGVPADAWALGDGMAWVPMSTTGEVVLLDGTTGRLAGRIGGLGAGPLVVALDGSNAVVLNPDAEAAFRVDAASQTLAGVGSAGETGIRFPHAERVVVGGDVGYVLQPDLQQVQAIDPVTLRPLGPPTVFVGSDFDAAAGEEGSLWLLDREAGRLQEVDGSRQGAFADLGWSEEDAGVVLVDDLPVVVNRTRGTVATVDADTGRLQDRVECQWFRRGEHGVQVGGSPGSPWLALAVPTTGTVLVADLLAEDCAAPIAVADLGSSFGAPVSADGLVYVPVISTGMVVVVDPRRETIVGQNQVVDQPGTHFELVVDDGLVFFNAPFSHESGVVSPQADVARIDKSQTLGGAGDSACTVSSQQVAVGDPIAFAIDEDGTPFDRAEWRFGDGKEANGLQVEHVYSAPGRYEPTVALNGVVVACPAITVDEQDVARLEARIGGPAQVVVGETVTYTDVTEAEVASREWRLPGGTPPAADTDTVEVRFATPGIQVIELTVSGPAGNDTAEARIEVLTTAPTDRRDPRPVPDPDGTGGGSPTSPEPSPSSPSGPPPPASGCANPTATLSGERATVSAGGSVRFDLVFGPDANRCEVTGVDWFVNGTVVASDAETLTQRFDAPGRFEVRATFTYRTAQGAPASGLPNPAALPITVDRPTGGQPVRRELVGNRHGASRHRRAGHRPFSMSTSSATACPPRATSVSRPERSPRRPRPRSTTTTVSPGARSHCRWGRADRCSIPHGSRPTRQGMPGGSTAGHRATGWARRETRRSSTTIVTASPRALTTARARSRTRTTRPPPIRTRPTATATASVTSVTRSARCSPKAPSMSRRHFSSTSTPASWAERAVSTCGSMP